MNAKDEAKLTMFRGLEQHFDANPGIFSIIAASVTAINAFKAIIAAIINTEQLIILELNKITKTNSTGKYTVTVTKEGYQTFEKDEIEVKLGDIRHLNVSLTGN